MEVPRSGGPCGSIGLSLIELLVALVIVATLLVVAVPSMSNMVSESRLRGAADNLMTHLRYAMAESTKRGRSISVSFVLGGEDGTWCYGMSESGGCNCSVAGSCVYDGMERVVASRDYPGVGAEVSVAYGRFSFQPKRNTVTAGHVTFTAANHKVLRIVVSGYGRLRSCSPVGATYLAGQAVC